MKKLLLSILSVFCLLAAHAQTAQQYFDQGNKYFAAKDYDNAITYFKKANELYGGNNAASQYNIGLSYYNKGNYSQAVYWYRKAAEQGNMYAQQGLGVCYFHGEGVEEDFAQAQYWLRKAAEQGYGYSEYVFRPLNKKSGSEQKNNAGRTSRQCFDEGNKYLAAKDYDNAITYFKKANELYGGNDPASQCNIGLCYYNKQNYSQALYWWRKSAEQGSSDAQFNLGFCYKKGKGVEQNYSQAVYWYRKAAEQGHSLAQNDLGVCYEKGEGIRQNNAQAVYWYRKAAEQGYSVAQNNLNRYNKVRNERVNNAAQTARQYFDKGNKYLAAKDYDNALTHFKKANDLYGGNNAECQDNIGQCYFYKQDYSQAVYWWRKASEQGYSVSQNVLGCSYVNGRGVEQDYSQAVYWFRKAAEQGNKEAQRNLGDCYKYGNGVEQSVSMAKYWYEKAGYTGNPDAMAEALEKVFGIFLEM